jgi:predicted dehydrogenase
MPTTFLSRRSFLSRAAACGVALAAPTILPARVFGRGWQAAPGNRVTIGMIGVGDHGVARNLRGFLAQPDAQIVAVCDVDGGRCAKAQAMVNKAYGNSDCAAYRDFRDILARSDVDAVMISTPDHWHSVISLMAIRAGKDVICEKPTLTIQEGRIVSDVVRQTGALFQTSTEDRSLIVYHRVAELVRNKRIGKLQVIRVGLPDAHRAVVSSVAEPVPADFDYELWLGPAPLAPYCAARCHYNFRWITDYSGGMLPDWGMHLFDTAQWANDTEHTGPVSVEGRGEFPAEGLYNTASEFHLEYTYANGVKMFADSGGVGLRFEGTEGWIANKGWIGALEASSPEILKSRIGPNEINLETCLGGEHRNFLDCVKTRRACYFPAEIGHRCATVCHIGNAALLLGRKLRWDPVKEEFPGDATANRLRARSLRAPWTLDELAPQSKKEQA